MCIFYIISTSLSISFLILLSEIFWSRHQESNLDLDVRSVLFYPLNYSEMAGLTGIEPITFVSKTKMISISPKTELVLPPRIELGIQSYQDCVIPLNYRSKIFTVKYIVIIQYHGNFIKIRW